MTALLELIITKSFRGLRKVRDLPESGIVYLKRIYPIEAESEGLPVGLPPSEVEQLIQKLEFVPKVFGTSILQQQPQTGPVKLNGSGLARNAGVKVVRRKKIRKEKRPYIKSRKSKRNESSLRVSCSIVYPQAVIQTDITSLESKRS